MSDRAPARTATLALLATAGVVVLAVAPVAAASAPAGGWASGLDATAGIAENDSDGWLSLNGSVTVGDGNDTTVDADATVDDGTVSGDASTAVETDDGTGVNATASATTDGENATLALEATTADGISLTAGASLGDSDGDDDSRAAPPPAGDDAAGGDGDSAGDGGESDVPVSPEEAGAGVAIGSLLVGAGLLARQFAGVAAAPGGGGSLLASAIAVLRAWGWRLLAVAGYQRFDDSDPLEHDTRASIHDYLRDEPGAYLQEVSDATGVPLSTLRYHLRILGYENLVSSVKIRGKRRYFPADVDPDALAPALEDEATAKVLEALAVAPDSVSGLADRLDRDPSTVSHHLQRLDDEGLVERERDGRSVVNRLADDLDERTVVAATGRPVATSAD